MTKPTGVGRGGRRPGAGRPRKPLPPEVLEALAAIRADLAYLRQQHRDGGEAVPALQRRIVALERHTGLVEDPKMPRLTRRHPLGAE